MLIRVEAATFLCHLTCHLKTFKWQHEVHLIWNIIWNFKMKKFDLENFEAKYGKCLKSVLFIIVLVK